MATKTKLVMTEPKLEERGKQSYMGMSSSSLPTPMTNQIQRNGRQKLPSGWQMTKLDSMEKRR
jgi:hypothetical protein